jgi:hypothetical protein
VVGVGTTSARADHQHKKELPVSGAANANHILGLDATGLIPQWEAVTTVTELKPAVANEAALPATGNTAGDIRVTLDDGNMHVWIAATVTPAVAAHWDKIGPAAANVSMATAAPLNPAATAAVGTSLAAAREDHVHKAELPTSAAADKGKVLALDATGLKAEWVTTTPGIIVSATAPTPQPPDGTGWFDSNNGTLSIAFAGKWVQVGGGGVAPPAVPVPTNIPVFVMEAPHSKQLDMDVIAAAHGGQRAAVLVVANVMGERILALGKTIIGPEAATARSIKNLRKGDKLIVSIHAGGLPPMPAPSPALFYVGHGTWKDSSPCWWTTDGTPSQIHAAWDFTSGWIPATAEQKSGPYWHVNPADVDGKEVVIEVTGDVATPSAAVPFAGSMGVTFDVTAVRPIGTRIVTDGGVRPDWN